MILGASRLPLHLSHLKNKGGGDKPYCSSRLLYSVGVTPHTFLNARTKLL